MAMKILIARLTLEATIISLVLSRFAMIRASAAPRPATTQPVNFSHCPATVPATPINNRLVSSGVRDGEPASVDISTPQCCEGAEHRRLIPDPGMMAWMMEKFGRGPGGRTAAGDQADTLSAKRV